MCAVILWGFKHLLRISRAFLGWFGRDIQWAMCGPGIGYFAKVVEV